MTPEPHSLSPMLLKLMAHMRKSPDPFCEVLESAAPSQPLGPDAWRDDFRLWGTLDEDARHKEYGSWVAPFYLDFCVWLDGRGAHSCSRATFERLMREEMGVLITDGEISGLHLRLNRRLKTVLKKKAAARKSGKQAAL